MCRKLLIFLFFVIALTVSAQSHFYTSEKLSSNQITHICQDKEGYLWIGTEYGLNKYDGYRFTNYLHDEANSNSVPSNVISYLFQDADGTLWVGTQTGLCKYNPANNQFVPVEMKGATSVPRINAIVQEDNNHLLVGTAGYGLFRVDVRDNSTKKLDGYAKADNNYFSYIFIDEKGCFWKSGYGNSIIRRTPNGQMEEFLSPYGTVTGFVGYEGGVFIVCNHGLLFYRDGELITDYLDPGDLRGKDLLLRTAKCDKNGNLFIGTMGNGLWWVPRGEHQMRRYDFQNALVDLNTATIWALFQDNQDNLWIGCQKRGLLMIPQHLPSFRTWKFIDQHITTGGSLTSICAGDNGAVGKTGNRLTRYVVVAHNAAAVRITLERYVEEVGKELSHINGNAHNLLKLLEQVNPCVQVTGAVVAVYHSYWASIRCGNNVNHLMRLL